MVKTVTHERATVPSSELTAISGATELTDKSTLHKTEAEAVTYIVETRRENRGEDYADLIVILEDWAHESWSDIDIASNKVLVVGKMDDHSDKAFKVEGAYEVQMDLIEGRSLEEVKGEYITSLIEPIDETDKDFIDLQGETFLPKSAIQAVFVLDD